MVLPGLPENIIREPYDVFRNSVTPPGLYARQKWLRESSTGRWKAEFAATVADLYRGQSADGLWRGSPIETIHRLFGLHLTVRNPGPDIDKALDALLKIVSDSASQARSNRLTPVQLRGLPFTQGPLQTVILAATMFLCTIFGRSAAPAILAVYNRVSSGIVAGALETTIPSFYHNILRALVVHPQYKDHPATHNLMDRLAGRQTAQGDWGPEIPFYQAFNALAHLDSPAANLQIKRALDHLIAMQNADGTWGESERQWNTFLAVHALRSKGVI